MSISSCEAELFAISQSLRILTYFRGILIEMQMIPRDYQMEIHSDSKSAIALCADNAGMSPQKHIDIRLKHIQEKIASGLFTLIHIPGPDNLADGFTKPLGIEKHLIFLNRIMKPMPSSNTIAS